MKTSRATQTKRGGLPAPIHTPPRTAAKTKRRGVAFRDLPGVTVRLTRDAEAVLRDLYDTGRGWLPREVLAQAVFNLGVECIGSEREAADGLQHVLQYAPRQGWLLTRGRAGAGGGAVLHLPDGYNPDAKRERKARR